MKQLSLILTLFLITSISTAQGSDKPSIQKKNVVYGAQDFIATFSINYERLFPVGEKYTLGLRGGLGRDGGNKDNVAIIEGLVLYGKPKHLLEVGLGYQHPNLFESGSDDKAKLALMAGWRYQAPKGFMLKAYAEFLPDVWPEEDSWGHLPFLGFALGYSW